MGLQLREKGFGMQREIWKFQAEVEAEIVILLSICITWQNGAKSMFYKVDSLGTKRVSQKVFDREWEGGILPEQSFLDLFYVVFTQEFTKRFSEEIFKF